MMGRRKTRIICTIGPAVSSHEMLEKLVKAGMDAARINFSHGSHAEFFRIIDEIRKLEVKYSRPIGILADIQGPKIRVGKLPQEKLELAAGMEAWIIPDGFSSPHFVGKSVIPTSYKDFAKDVDPGHTVLIDDGLIALKVRERQGQTLRCEVINPGTIYTQKGINVPEASFSSQSITEKDYDDILFSLENGVDFIALSFVRTPQEVRYLRQFIQSRQKRIGVLAKIEKREALSHLDEIINAADGILIARGDLGVEVGNERVPVLQKKIIRQCNLKGKTVIIATQMLMSMVENPRPTRAEASDVANAIIDGTDALMLSNETTVGKYPIESLLMMDKIAQEMEQESSNAQPILYNEWQLPPQEQLAIALLQSAVRLAALVKARWIIVITQSGHSALLVSKCRPNNPVFAITGSRETYRQNTLKWGVQSLLMEDMDNLISQTAVFEAIGQRLLALNLCSTGDRIVITIGLPRLEHGSTNTIKVHQI